jgi:molybdopterin/thiamine biosynthesis adenylyltransferase/rhodanese-related sulfurtransferase
MPKSYADLLREAREQVREVSAAEAATAREDDPRVVLLDVREETEWEAGHAAGALHVSKSYLEQDIEGAVPDRDRPIVIYCAGGIRSLFAGQTLQALGYTNVASMAGGFQSWKAQGLEWDMPRILSEAQKHRYSRHLLIPEVGVEGQGRLLDAKVLLVGAGGLGSPAALYLAAAGVGTIGIVDFDVVDSARKTINALNPEVNVVGHEEMLTEANVERIIAGYDVILDGTDTFETRYTVNDAAVAAGIPVVHASVFRFEGQLTVFKPFDGPCYRCLYPTPPPPELAPGCSVAGVLGIVPGIMGMLQANEVLKLILGLGDSLAGRLLLFDALDASFTELRLKRDPACPVCSDAAVAARAAGGSPSTPSPADPGVFTLGGSFGAGAPGSDVAGPIGGPVA